MVFRCLWLVSMVYQGGFMVFHGFWLFSMVFQGGFMGFAWFPWIFKVVSWFSQARSEMLRTPKRYSLHLHLGPTIPLGLAGRRPALA